MHTRSISTAVIDRLRYEYASLGFFSDLIPIDFCFLDGFVINKSSANEIRIRYDF